MNRAAPESYIILKNYTWVWVWWIDNTGVCRFVNASPDEACELFTGDEELEQAVDYIRDLLNQGDWHVSAAAGAFAHLENDGEIVLGEQDSTY